MPGVAAVKSVATMYRCGMSLKVYIRVQSALLAAASLFFLVWAIIQTRPTDVDTGIYVFEVPMIGGLLGVAASFRVGDISTVRFVHNSGGQYDLVRASGLGNTSTVQWAWAAMVVSTLGALIVGSTYVWFLTTPGIHKVWSDNMYGTKLLVYLAINAVAWLGLAAVLRVPFQAALAGSDEQYDEDTALDANPMQGSGGAELLDPNEEEAYA